MSGRAALGTRAVTAAQQTPSGAESFERALWTALRTLDEKVTLASRLQVRTSERGNDRLAERYQRLADESMEVAEVPRHLISAPMLDITRTES